MGKPLLLSAAPVIRLAWFGLLALASFYIALLLLLFLFQRQLLYPAPPGVAPVPDGYRRVMVTTSDGLSLDAAYREARGDLPTIAFFHGNGDNWAGSSQAMRPLANAGYGVMLAEYRGYGGNPGKPSEEGLYRDGRAVLDWLAGQGIAGEGLVIVGNSLGSGVATQLATERSAGALVLQSGFTSVPDVAAGALPIFPVRALMKDRFANLAKIGAIAMPVLVMHGTRDRVVPHAHGEALSGAAGQAKFLSFPGVGHELPYRPEAGEAVLRWLLQMEH